MDDRMIGVPDRNVTAFVRNFHDLEVYKKAFATSLMVHRASLEFPKIEQYALADQIRRASKSICANIAEGFAKQQTSKPDFRRFLLIALGSAHEMQVWISYCKALDYVTPATSSAWEEDYASISRMLQSFINKV